MQIELGEQSRLSNLYLGQDEVDGLQSRELKQQVALLSQRGRAMLHVCQ